MSKGKVVGLIIECPKCKGDNEIQYEDVSDPQWTCQYTHCLEVFETPSADDARQYAQCGDHL